MPPRIVSLAILVYWLVGAFFLLKWEVVPELTLGYPPDLRAIAAAAGESPTPVSWSIDVIDDPRRPEARRSVGKAVTDSNRLADGSYALSSRVDFDAAEVLKQSPLSGGAGVKLSILGEYRVDPHGDLRSFTMDVKGGDSEDVFFNVQGKVNDGVMDVQSRGIASMMNIHRKFPYEPRSVVSDSLRPLDRLPGLHVGQRWDMKIINPLSGAVETARVVVERRTFIDWNGEAVSAFEVVQTAGPIKAKTWVRLDGVILRQQVPLPFVEMVLERLPDPTPKPNAEPAAETTP